MSLKRPLSPESNENNIAHNDTRQLKRLKLHSIIQQLRNEEAKLILLKKLRTNQQLATRTNKSSTPISNGFHPTATRLTTNTPAIPPSKPIANIPSQQPSIPRKTSNSPLLTNSNKISSHPPLDERKTQAKLSLSKQIERELLSIPPPKPTLQDIPFIPNGNSLEFPPLIGLEDVVQCLSELQNDRHRLPQRFTDHASIDNPHICDQCGTDFTIRWWKHLNTKSSNDVINILCDRCKKQVLRRTLKSKHSTLLKNVFLSGMKQEKEIEKNFHTLIKQEKQSSRTKSSVPTNPQPMLPTTLNYIPASHQQYQVKNHFPQQNFATKISQQTTRKSNGIVQSSNHHSRTVQQTKSAMPVHHQHQHQQQFRSNTVLPQQMKTNQMVKPSKTSMKQPNIIPSAHSIFQSNQDLFHAFLASNLVRPTTTKRRNVPTVEFK